MGDRAGQQLGQYRLIQLIGQGGFGDVYLGEHLSEHTNVAIKVMDVELAELTREDIESFLAHTRIAASLDHPNILHVLAFGEQDSLPFLVMDYAPNGSLRQLHPKGTRLPLSTVVSYVKQIASALQYLHEQNLVHRDVKPHNILVGANHELLLSDFGIAVESQSMGYRRQKVQDFEGTILYAAPEQIRGRSRFASDQYALGVLTYEWLTGSCPFYGTVEEVASQHTLVPPRPLREKLPTLSPAVEQVVLKALAKDVNERYESVQEFARAFERASRLEQGSSPRISHPLTPAPPSPLPTAISLPEERVVTPQAVILTYRGHTDKVHMLAWSPDGSSIASSSLDETVQVWDVSTGETILTHRSNALQAQAFAWSPDGKYIASTDGLSSEKIQVWDASTGQPSTQHTPFTGHSEQVHSLAWSPDGKYIASASDDKTVQVWDALTGRTIFIYRGHTLGVRAIAWSPDGKRMASASDDKTVHVWDAPRGGNSLVYYGHLDKINALTWSPGGTLVASASDDKTVQIWDSSTGRKVFTYSSHTGGVTSVSWSHDGMRLTSASLDETVHIINILTERTLSIFTGHSDWVSTVAWSPDGNSIASGSWDKTVQVWKVK